MTKPRQGHSGYGQPPLNLQGCLGSLLLHISGVPRPELFTHDFLQQAEAPIAEVIFLLQFLSHS